MSDWNSDAYSKFSALRLRPAVDLLMKVPPLVGDEITDLGCGNGAVGPVLRTRFPKARIAGLDSSPAMLEDAWKTGAYDALTEGDIAKWRPETPPALIYSNAALHWLPNHATLLPELAGHLAPGGTLAVQMPHQNSAPSHRLWIDLVDQHFPGRYDPDQTPGILDARTTYDLLDPLGHLTLWETEYMQRLDPATDAHPVRLFTSSTFARPVLNTLDADEQGLITRLYDEAMELAYPRRADDSVLFPFRRLFFILTRP
ncbi:methyltransferase domain-containing protein [Pseudooceanicola onchidii]|uniref:methyltransferase domain-containing protein n=1 Tax=Pseudooceanicola onchidii TaxID=2562279 RepID=UPI0010AAECF6|nr:methyltransferase domain-containing protein [Pseudooceanicola onchidii]